jgi:hypothetical protein
MDWEFWLLLGLYLVTPIGLFVGRNWIKARIERSVQHGFDVELENLRAEVRKSEEDFKSELRLKEAEITALRDGILTGRAQRQALLDKRRLDAVERVWSAISELAPLRGVSALMAVINFEAASEEAPRNPKVRQFFETISRTQVPDIANVKHSARDEQPFVSALAWAYFSAYQTIVLGSYIRAKILEFGIEKAGKLLNDNHVKDVLRAALPHQSEFIDKYDPLSYHYLLDELEKNLLAELQKMLHGEDQDEAGVAHAARIMEMVRKTTEEKNTGRAELMGRLA